MAGGWGRVAAVAAADVCSRFALGPEAAAALTPGMAPRPYLAALADRGLYPDAVRFLAFALPKREALWWACGCVRKAGAARTPAEAAALDAAEAYVVTPTDAARRAALDAGEAAGFGTPAGAAAAAAFFSAGSLAPPTAAAVPPAEHLTPTTAANAIILAAVAPDPAAAPDRYRAFLDLGQAVADGANRWPTAR